MIEQNKVRLSIVIPVYNSEKTIYSLGEKLLKALGTKYDFELVLVNDNSKDNSEKECEKLCVSYPENIQFLSLAKNAGEHNAVMAGLNHVSGDYIVIMDDDFQNPVNEVEKLVLAAKNDDYDVVYTYYGEKKHAFFRNIGSRFNDKVANIMMKKPKKLYLSSFKLITKPIVDEIIKYDHPYPYIDGFILRTTENIGQVLVEHNTRKQGKSNYTFKKLVKLWLNMFTNFSILPLRIAIILGLFFSIAGIIFAGYTVYEKILNPDLPVGWAALMVAISLFGGIQLLALGMIGEYLGRMFLSINRSPQYVIRKYLKKS